MKTLLFMFFALTVAVPTMAVPPEVRPTPAVCKADLKAWTNEKLDKLTSKEITDRMDTMFTCAEETQKRHPGDKNIFKYLYEMYLIHAELGARAYDFIERHGFSQQYGEEEKQILAAAQTASKTAEVKH